jgi:hypothetical protein
LHQVDAAPAGWNEHTDVWVIEMVSRGRPGVRRFVVTERHGMGLRNGRTGMKRFVQLIIFVGCCIVGSSAWAIDCLSAPGISTTGWYSWREIEGRKCWFKKIGVMPPKSQLHWVNTREEAHPIKPAAPAKYTTDSAAAAPPRADVTNTPKAEQPMPTHFKTARVKSVGTLGHGNGDKSIQKLGAQQKSIRFAPADSFNTRFTGRGD